jgi:hypothetical protein
MKIERLTPEEAAAINRKLEQGLTPDLQDAAVQKLLQQAEALSMDWAA